MTLSYLIATQLYIGEFTSWDLLKSRLNCTIAATGQICCTWLKNSISVAILSGFVSNTAWTYVICPHNLYNHNNNAMEVKKASFLSYVSCLFLVIFLGCHRCLVSFQPILKKTVSTKNIEIISELDDENNIEETNNMDYWTFSKRFGQKSGLFLLQFLPSILY